MAVVVFPLQAKQTVKCAFWGVKWLKFRICVSKKNKNKRHLHNRDVKIRWQTVNQSIGSLLVKQGFVKDFSSSRPTTQLGSFFLQIPLLSPTFVGVIDLKTCIVHVALIDQSAPPVGMVINGAWWAGDGAAVIALIYLTLPTDRDS